MSEPDSHRDQTPQPAPQPAAAPQAQAAAPKKVRRKRWIILKIVPGMVVVLLLLILVAPTLLSTGPGLSIVLGQVNKRLNGKVEMQSLSVGWMSGIDLNGLRVKDAQGTQIAELDHLKVPLPLWKVITGNYALGQVPIDGLSFDARTDSQGRSNFADLLKPAKSSSAGSDGGNKKTSSSKPLQLSGDITLTNCRGTYTEFGQPTIYLRKLDAEVKIPPSAAPIDDASISINALTAALKDDSVMKLSVTNGSLTGLLSKRSVQLPVSISYDLAEIWPIVQPQLGDKYKTLKVTGTFTKQFNITGSYPADKPFTEAIKSLHADGDLEVGLFDYDGLNLQKLIVPLALDDGKLVTVYAGKPAGQNMAAPAIANGGTLDVGGVTIDLTQSPMRLSIPANKALMTKVTINPLFANTFLTHFINDPVFTGSGGSGFFECTILDCVDLPLSSILMQAVPENTGKVDAKFSLEPLVIGVDGISGLEKLVKTKLFTAKVHDGTVSVARGLSKEHVSFAVGKGSIELDGTVRLSDEALVPMNASVVLAGVGHFTVPVEGTVEHARISPDKVLNSIKDELQKDLLHGGSNGNPLDGLLKKLDKKKN